MNETLPDVSRAEAAPGFLPLEWVGMSGIDLPLLIDEPDVPPTVAAQADVQVDLPAADIKGIHMSRLYRLLDGLSTAPLRMPVIEATLRAMIDSHQDCGSQRARLRLAFPLLVRRPALVTAGLSGWKSYPVRLDVTMTEAGLSATLQVTVTYSSTCPCSAALSRQVLAQRFLEEAAPMASLTPEQVADWLRRYGSLATPHSQRSEAEVRIALPSKGVIPIMMLIDHVEGALGTPVQTLVKRADEQAFAVRNGENLMFVEDAARRIQQALAPHFHHPRVQVRHLESLHPHDAVAWAGEAQKD